MNVHQTRKEYFCILLCLSVLDWSLLYVIDGWSGGDKMIQVYVNFFCTLDQCYKGLEFCSIAQTVVGQVYICYHQVQVIKYCK